MAAELAEVCRRKEAAVTQVDAESLPGVGVQLERCVEAS